MFLQHLEALMKTQHLHDSSVFISARSDLSGVGRGSKITPGSRPQTSFAPLPALNRVNGEASVVQTQAFGSFVHHLQHQKLTDSGIHRGSGRGRAWGLGWGRIGSLPPSSRCPFSPAPPAHLPFFLPPQAKLQLSDFSLLGSFQLDVLTSQASSQCVCASASVCFWVECLWWHLRKRHHGEFH